MYVERREDSNSKIRNNHHHFLLVKNTTQYAYVPGIQPANVAVTPRHSRKNPSLLIISTAHFQLEVPHLSHWTCVFNVSIGNVVICSAKPASDPATM